MSEEDLEILITLDDPGEEDQKVDTFDHSHGDSDTRRKQKETRDKCET